MSSYCKKAVGSYAVDSYVDGECSSEERSAIEARARIDSRVDRAIKQTKELRLLLREIPAKPPKEFETRLRDAIMNSSSWDELRSQKAYARETKAACVERVFTPFSRRLVSPVSVGAAAILVAVAVVGACLTLTQDKRAEDESSTTFSTTSLARTEAPIVSNASNAAISEPLKLNPSPEGNAPESVSKADSQENYWAIVRVDDQAQAKKHKLNLQTRCAELNVSFSKSGEDEQFRLQDVSGDQWRQLVDVWNEREYERSEALTKWEENPLEERTIRVTFKLNAN